MTAPHKVNMAQEILASGVEKKNHNISYRIYRHIKHTFLRDSPFDSEFFSFNATGYLASLELLPLQDL